MNHDDDLLFCNNKKNESALCYIFIELRFIRNEKHEN